MKVVAYDLDGVLAAPVPAEIFAKAWRHMNGVERVQRQVRLLEWYVRAPRLHHPQDHGFHVVTARKATPDVQEVTRNWLVAHYGDRLLSLHMLTESRTAKNVVSFKSRVLRELGATDFTEDNRAIVRALRKAELRCRIWHYVKGNSVLDYEPGFV